MHFCILIIRPTSFPSYQQRRCSVMSSFFQLGRIFLINLSCEIRLSVNRRQLNDTPTREKCAEVFWHLWMPITHFELDRSTYRPMCTLQPSNFVTPISAFRLKLPDRPTDTYIHVRERTNRHTAFTVRFAEQICKKHIRRACEKYLQIKSRTHFVSTISIIGAYLSRSMYNRGKDLMPFKNLCMLRI